MSDADEIKRWEWEENGIYFAVEADLDRFRPFVMPENLRAAYRREILRLANENFKLKCDLAANQGYGDGLATLCEQNRELAEKAERELAEAREDAEMLEALWSHMDLYGPKINPKSVLWARIRERVESVRATKAAVKAAMEGK